MPIDLRIDLVGKGGSPIRNPRNLLERVRKRAVPFAMKAALDMIAADLKLQLVRQWKRDLPRTRRRRTFPRNVIRVRKAFVNKQGLVVRPARVVSVAGNDVIRLQMRGGIRKPHGKALFIPGGGKRSVRRSDKNYKAGQYLFKHMRSGDRYLAVFAKSAKYRPRFNPMPALNRTARKAPGIAARRFEKELNDAFDRAT